MIEKDRQHLRKQFKLLLLGAGESGKSTFLKQMKIIHGIKFDPDQISEYQTTIYQNIIRGMRVLVDARNKLLGDLPWESEEIKNYGSDILKFENSTKLDTRLFTPYVPKLSLLWKDTGIRRAYERRREFQLSDSVYYFLENLDRISRIVSISKASCQMSVLFFCTVPPNKEFLFPGLYTNQQGYTPREEGDKGYFGLYHYDK